MSVVINEILYTRVFGLIYFSSFAFLMISLAVFGSGLSGVFMSISKFANQKNMDKKLEYLILTYAISIPIVYKIILTYKIDFLSLNKSFTNFIPLLVNILVLIIPYFLSGIILVLIFSLHSKEIGKLYFIDLIGAALGGIALIPLIQILGPANSIIIISVVILFLWFLISNIKTVKKINLLLIMLIVCSFVATHSNRYFRIVPQISKRSYKQDLHKNTIEYSKWSPINKIDVAPFIFRPKTTKIIWLNGGTQQSWLRQVNPKVKQRNMKRIAWMQEALPFQMTKKDNAMIIGSAGGFELQCALSNQFKDIYAVEMDPVICEIVKGRYSKFIGNIFRRKGVHLINDEGRSVLKRLNKKFDVIQMVNSHNSDSLLSGGLSIAETYIYTVESFKDYWKHLDDDGFLYIIHIFGERLFTTGFKALRELGVKEPEKKFIVLQSDNGFNYFFMKKGDVSDKDKEIIDYFIQHYNKYNVGAGLKLAYFPGEKIDTLYYKIISDFDKTIKDSSVNIRPVYDNSPYLNQANKIGQLSFKNNFIKGWGKKTAELNQKYSNSVYLSILFMSILVSILLIFVPLKIKSKGKPQLGKIFYFFTIGLAFMITEIIMIKIFQLYLGNPAYSISFIIFSILIAAGTGSFLSNKITSLLGNKIITVFSILLFILLIAYAYLAFPLLNALIKYPLSVRFLVSFIVIFVAGFPMGFFFPVGLRKLGEEDSVMIGWAWGANAFATVFGSVFTVIIAINYSFTLALIIAALTYLMSGFIFKRYLDIKL